MLVLWRERTVIREEAEERARWSLYEHSRSHANDIVAIFLRAIVEDDYAAVRPLLRQVASEPPRAAKAFGPEIQLRDKIHGWMAERGVAAQRLNSYGYGNNAAMNADNQRYVVTGALFFDDGKVVGFRLTLRLTADRDGYRSSTFGWRVDDLVRPEGPRHSPREVPARTLALVSVDAIQRPRISRELGSITTGDTSMAMTQYSQF